MDTPEGDVSAIESGTLEPLPRYVEEETALSGLQALVAALPVPSSPWLPLDRDEVEGFIERQTTAQPKNAGPPEPIMEFPHVGSGAPISEVIRIRQAIVTGFFTAISEGQEEAIALFITNNLVTANTTNDMKKTPLLAAVATKNMQIAQELLDFGADPNAFGVESFEERHYPDYGTPVKRTPLQLAASLGHLPLVKLLIEVYHVNDSLVAPDGQIALRLASQNNHREVVDYLPTRRGGGFRRWQYHHQRAIRRTKRAVKKIYQVFKFFLWDIEKFFVWTIPKHLIYKPLVEGCTWCWKNKHFLGPWCARQAQKMPGRAKRFGWFIWRVLKAVPKAAADGGKAVWKFSSTTLPRWVKKLSLWIWSLFTVRIPKATAIAAKWIWNGMSAVGRAVLDVILKVVSLLHTVFEAALTFFRNLTLKDVWNGFCSLLHAIFVAFPKTLWSWVLQFSDISLKIMKAVFGEAGEILWCIIYGIGWLVTYVPRKLWVILQSLGGSFAKGWYEVLVFFKPKA